MFVDFYLGFFEKSAVVISINFNCHNKTINDALARPYKQVQGRLGSEASRPASAARVDSTLQMQGRKTRVVHPSQDTPRLLFHVTTRSILQQYSPRAISQRPAAL